MAVDDTRSSKIINAQPLVDIVRQRLIEDIMERRYLPGQKLPVVEMAARYGVSETPVKQAFNRLVSEGLLDALPRRGVVVRRVTLEDTRELMEARHMVNLASVDAVINCLADGVMDLRERIEANLAEHSELLNEVQDHLTIDVFLRYVRIDREYHLIYLTCLSNRTIERFFDQLHNQSYAFVSLSELMARRIRQAQADHTSIYQAALSQNRSRLVDALMRHKEGAISTVASVFAEEIK